jgi:hypothetical protein
MADDPGADDIGCVLAVDNPAVASAFDIGHRYREELRFLFAASPFARFCEFADIVDDVDELDDIDEEELERETVFLDGMSILETSSGFDKP